MLRRDDVAAPELYHYTRPAAFEGIIGSQTLWCSHYREMLDTNEVRLMRDLLPAAVAPRMDAIVEKLNRRSAGCGTPLAAALRRRAI